MFCLTFLLDHIVLVKELMARRSTMSEAVTNSQRGGLQWLHNTNKRQHSVGAIRVRVMENCTDSVKL